MEKLGAWSLVLLKMERWEKPINETEARCPAVVDADGKATQC